MCDFRIRRRRDMTDYDVLIIGSGASGQTVAAACAKAGKRVAVVDRLPFGGTCSLRGCEPKKMLLAGAEAIGRTSALEGRGVTGSCRIDWPALMQRKRDHVAPVPQRTLSWMHDLGILTFQGTARFTSPETVEVAGEPVRAAAIVVAAGARPMALGVEGEDDVLTSTDFLELDAMPASVAFIGGGYISFELARLAQLAGAKATIVHRSRQVLKGFDSTLADALAERYRTLGIDVLVNAPAQRVERLGDGRFSIVTPRGAIEADLVFHGAGRVPDLDDLDLAVGGVDATSRGVSVNAHLRSTSNPIVWSCGDAAGAGMPLTPVASAQGQVVADNVLGGSMEFDDTATASVVFGDPPLARVGADASAAESDDRLEVRSFDMSRWFTQARVGNTAAGAKLVLERDTGAIKGAHLLGVGAEEIVNVFAVAIRYGVTIGDLRTMTWSYPTLAYDINYLSGRY
jgi:glutathione reductase (NADPH)